MGDVCQRFCLQILTDLVKLFFAVPSVILVVGTQVFIILVKIEIVSWPGQNLPPRHHLDTVMTTNLTSPIFWKGLSCNNDDSVSLAHVFLTTKTGVLPCFQTLLILNYHFQPDLSCIIHTEFATLDNLNKYKMRILFISLLFVHHMDLHQHSVPR